MGIKKLPEDQGKATRSLRAEAEKRLAQGCGASSGITGEARDKIIHELHVHQIELEMQNEALRKAQLNLEAARDKYIELYDFAPVGYFTFSRRGVIEEVNLAGAALLGVERGKLLNRGLGHFIAETDLGRWDWHLKAVLEQGEAQTCELPLKHEDGSIIQTQLDSIRVNTGSGNAVIRSTMSDISGRKKAEGFNKSILESVGEGFIVIDRDYRIISANRAYCDQKKTLFENIIGKRCYEVSHHATKPCYEAGEACAPRHTFLTGQVGTALHTHFDREGNPVYVETKSYPMKDQAGKVISVIEITNDITQRKKLEEQLRHAQKMEAIGILAGGIAHDFNNILTAIIGYGSIALMKMPKDDALRLNIEHMLESAERAAHLTQGLLAFSRKQPLLKKPADLNEIIRRVEKFLVRVIGEDVQCNTILPAGTIPVLVDANQLEQVLMNFATNARDAMPNGGQFTVATEQVKLDEQFIKSHGYGKPGLYGMITVSDTGFGMDEATQLRIFEPFFTTKEMGKGTGLGLSIVYGIIKQHDGFINVHSEPGKGTTFRIYLPIIAPRVLQEVKAPETTLPRGGAETILLAEDEAALRNMVKTMLEDFGYTVIAAVDGEDAVKRYLENKDRIQLLVFDLVMPKMSGKEAYDEIRKVMPDIPVIVVSGYSLDIIRQRALIEKEVKLVLKPFQPINLLKIIREELDRRAARGAKNSVAS